MIYYPIVSITVLVLIYINELPNAAIYPSAIVNLFADGVLLYHTVSNTSTSE